MVGPNVMAVGKSAGAQKTFSVSTLCGGFGGEERGGLILTLFSKINTCITDNDVTYIIMPRIAQESSKYLFPLWSFHNKIAD